MSFVRRTLARSVFLGFQIGVPRCRSVHHPGTCLASQASSFKSAQSLLALSMQRALCTFISLLSQASLHCCGLMVSSPGPCASSGGRLPEALFMVFLLDAKGAKACTSCRSRQELSSEYLVFTCKHRLRYSRGRASQSLQKKNPTGGKS